MNLFFAPQQVPWLGLSDQKEILQKKKDFVSYPVDYDLTGVQDFIKECQRYSFDEDPNYDELKRLITLMFVDKQKIIQILDKAYEEFINQLSQQLFDQESERQAEIIACKIESVLRLSTMLPQFEERIARHTGYRAIAKRQQCLKCEKNKKEIDEANKKKEEEKNEPVVYENAVVQLLKKMLQQTEEELLKLENPGIDDLRTFQQLIEEVIKIQNIKNENDNLQKKIQDLENQIKALKK